MTLLQMLGRVDYARDLLEVIVVDNASEDGSAEMVRSEFPEVRLIRREVNVGISGWNDGFEQATGELVLVLDDDCYLPGDGLRRAIDAMWAHAADMVSFSVAAAGNPDYRFDLAYKTGLLTFWGCAVLIRRDALARTGGFDPELFVWAHEVEWLLRFYDRGFRHLHLPEVTAVHMKDPGDGDARTYYGSRSYRLNQRHFGYIAARHLRGREAVATLVALLAQNVRHALRVDTADLAVVKETLGGFRRGLQRRDPLRNAAISRVYRRNFYSFSPPWWVMRPPLERLRERDPEDPPRRVREYYESRRDFYPRQAATLAF